ncbi:hypothetical protein BGZ76_006572, partial [Entomortierella beljakovae]
MTNEITLFCIVDGDSTAFPIDLAVSKTVGHLKDAIKKKKEPRFDDLAADELILYHVSVPSAPKRLIALNNLTVDEESRSQKNLRTQQPRSLKSLALLRQRKPFTSSFSVHRR